MTVPPALPAFDTAVADTGYRWWYLDAVSDCGRHALTIISSIGSVFSPYYFAGRARGANVASHYSSFNIALYGRPGGWAMTERSARWVQRSADTLTIGPSCLRREDLSNRQFRLHYDLNEITCPLPRQIRGDIRVDCPPAQGEPHILDAHGRHHWWPAVPSARVAVSLSRPALRWAGSAYVDSNWGEEPLEHAFRRWNWSRVHRHDGSCAIFYDLEWCNGGQRHIALQANSAGTRALETAPPLRAIPATRIWRMPRHTRALGDDFQVRTLEDTPFYSRSHLRFRDGLWQEGVHESVDLARFCRKTTQWMLPFRMPRRR